MSDFIKIFIFPLLVPVLVGIGSSAITSAALIGRLEERIVSMETRARQHEERLEYLRTRTEDQERQLARFEGTIAAISEIKLDLKELLKRQ